jgi:phage head maturation protease
MMTATATRREPKTIQRTFVPHEVRTTDLAEGVCGRVVGVGMVYDVQDSFATMWAPGCLDMTKRSKVSAGKVSLFTAGQLGHEYGVRSHVGVVREMGTRGNEEWVTADLFDTEDGRRTKEYLNAVLRSGGRTGLSIGCYVRRDEQTADGITRFTEVELEEFTITPRPAVPGADVDTVRQNPDAAWALFDALVATLSPDDVRARVARLPGHSDDPDQVAPGAASSTPEATASQSDDGRPAGTRVATEAERARALAAATLGTDYHV